MNCCLVAANGMVVTSSTIARKKKRTGTASFAPAELCPLREGTFFECLGAVVLADDLSCNV